ncbi:MAG: hypothetical protein QM778_03520 [Myxococcales bacterium]
MRGFLLGALVAISMLVGITRVAEAQVPTPSTSTPTVHGGTPVVGNVVLGEVGYAALKASLYLGGGGNRDVGIEAAIPTFGNDPLPGWGQNVGLDLRAPFRFLVSHWSKANGAFKIGPYFHVGNACRDCEARAIGLGVVGGFVTDIALPKLFKIDLGIEQQLGMWNGKGRHASEGDTRFAGATWVVLGLEAFWREAIFFTLVFNVGAQYGSDSFYYRDHALFRQMVGCGYKWR